MKIVLKNKAANEVDTIWLKDAKPAEVRRALSNGFVHGRGQRGEDVWISTDNIAFIIQEG